MVLSAGAGDVMTVSRVREDSPAQQFPKLYDYEQGCAESKAGAWEK